MTSRDSTEPFAPPGDLPRPDRAALGVLLAVAALELGLLAFRLELALPRYGWSLRPNAQIHPYAPGCWLGMLACGALGWWAWRLVAAPTRALPASGEGVAPTGPSPLAGRARVGAALLLLVAMHLGLQVTTDLGQGRTAWVINTVASTFSEVSNGYFATASRIERVPRFLRDYAELQRTGPQKLKTHPPGAVLAYWLPLTIYQRLPGVEAAMVRLIRAWAGDTNDVYLAIQQYPNVANQHLPDYLMGAALFCSLWLALAGALAVLPAYWLGAAGGDRRAGVLAAILLALMPNSLFYWLSLDTLLVTLLAAALAGVVYALPGDRLRAWPALGAGVGLGLTLFVSLGALAACGLSGVYALLAAARGRARWRHAVGALVLVASGVALVTAAVTLAGVDTAAVLYQGLTAHRHGGAGVQYRPYAPWVVFNVVDYVLLAGLPLTVVALGGLGRDCAEPVRSIGLAALATLLLLDLSGVTRAETERLWIFLNPALAATAAAAAVARAERFWTLAIQPLQLLLMALALPPLVRPC